MSDEVRTISVQIPLDLLAELTTLAGAHERSLSGEVRVALRAHVEAATAVTDEAAA